MNVAMNSEMEINYCLTRVKNLLRNNFNTNVSSEYSNQYIR